MEDFQKMMIEHMRKTEEHMSTANSYMQAARDARAQHDLSIKCLTKNFTDFRDTYGPPLAELVARKKWWAERIDEIQKRTVRAGLWGILVIGVAIIWRDIKHALSAILGG